MVIGFPSRLRKWCKMFCKNPHIDESLTTWDEVDDETLLNIVLIAVWHHRAKIWTIYGCNADAYVRYTLGSLPNAQGSIRSYAPLIAGHGHIYECCGQARDTACDLMTRMDFGSVQEGPVAEINVFMWHDADSNTLVKTPMPNALRTNLRFKLLDNRLLSIDDETLYIQGRECSQRGKMWTVRTLQSQLDRTDKLPKTRLCYMLAKSHAAVSADGRHMMSSKIVERDRRGG